MNFDNGTQSGFWASRNSGIGLQSGYGQLLLGQWDSPYKYACCPGQHDDYDLWSEGADKAPGGEGENADVTSWQSLKSRKAAQ